MIIGHLPVAGLALHRATGLVRPGPVSAQPHGGHLTTPHRTDPAVLISTRLIKTVLIKTGLDHEPVDHTLLIMVGRARHRLLTKHRGPIPRLSRVPRAFVTPCRVFS